MKYVLAAFGSRGDLAPIALLGRALQDAGQNVVVLGPDDDEGRYRTVVEDSGIKYEGHHWADYKVFFSKVTESGLRDHDVYSQQTIPWLIDNLPREADVLMNHVDRDTALITTGYCLSAGSVARFRGARHFSLNLTACSLRSAHWFPSGDRRSHGSLQEIDQAWDRNQIRSIFVFKKPLEEIARRIGLSTSLTVTESTFGSNVIFAVEPSLLPAASRVLRPEPIGCLLDNDASGLPIAVEEFVASDARPIVVVHFGSVIEPSPLFVLDGIIAAAKEIDVRLVIQGGWGNFGGVSTNDVLYIGSANHNQLFKKATLVVHHGGSGGTHRAAQTGTPQLVVPYWLDQFFWASRVHANDLGPIPVSRGQFSRDVFLASLRDGISNPRYQQSATALSKQMLPSSEQRIAKLLMSGDTATFAAGRHGEMIAK